MEKKKLFYTIKPLIPRSIQIWMRRRLVAMQRKKYTNIWPINHKAAKAPATWKGWPGNKKFALVLTHDVESEKGLHRCGQLSDLEIRLGFRSSFNFVAEKYQVPEWIRDFLIENGFEVGVHGLLHDGKLFNSRKIFTDRAQRINHFLKEYEAVGFRSPAMHHNLDWIHELNIEYDASTFDTDPFEPQSDGVSTIFPFKVNRYKNGNGNGNGRQKGNHKISVRSYIELPYTLAQDFTMFILLKQKNIDLWKQKLDWIAAHGGMALVNTHPDYMHFNGDKKGAEEYPADYYGELLEYIRKKYAGQYWHALPKDVAKFWRG